MAQTRELTVIQGNIIDVKWILSEETGKLSYEDLKVVRCKPAQVLLVEHTSKTVTKEFADRFRRILQDKRARL